MFLLILEFQDSKANSLPHFPSNGQGESQTFLGEHKVKWFFFRLCQASPHTNGGECIGGKLLGCFTKPTQLIKEDPGVFSYHLRASYLTSH